MNRHVIKGSGENRGKYLCWARKAPDEKPTGDGFVWLPEQREAVRWEDPRYSGHTWATDRARIHNGHFVRLTASKAIIDRVPELRAYIAKHADGAGEELACYWIHGANEPEARDAVQDIDDSGWNGDLDGESSNFCSDCADEVIDVLRALIRAKRPAADTDEDDDCGIERDGGWDIGHDSPPYCAKCGVKLSGNLTEHGADEQLSAFTSHAQPSFDDPDDWRDLDNAIVNLAYDDPRWRKIARVVDAAMVDEARTALLTLLTARCRSEPETHDRMTRSDQTVPPTPNGWRVVGTTGEGRLIAYGCACCHTQEEDFPSVDPRQTKPKRHGAPASPVLRLLPRSS